MPIYEYHCCDCNNDFETLVLRSSEKIVCPKCDRDHVERLMSACSYKSGGNFSSSQGSGCSSCSSSNCHSCH
ncbi:MAG: zinc ribbon domain-containing protein [Deltaproteobacteria bacterium]|nr:zinc ribbon domain-containing protein [Deltaproteobacteria bacterium]